MDEIRAPLADLVDETARLCASIERLGDAQVLEQPSMLPGWSRAHVLVHLARNADGLRNLLLSARTGRPVRMYASPQTRAADIEAGVTRPPEVIVADAVESSTRFLIEASAMPPEAWQAEVLFTSGHPDAPVLGARRLPEMRLEEVVIHHVDLAVDYGFDQLPEHRLLWFLERLAARRGRQGVPLAVKLDGSAPSTAIGDPAGSVVEGEAAALLAWLAGRSPAGVRSAQPLPELPSLG